MTILYRSKNNSNVYNIYTSLNINMNNHKIQTLKQNLYYFFIIKNETILYTFCNMFYSGDIVVDIQKLDWFILELDNIFFNTIVNLYLENLDKVLILND